MKAHPLAPYLQRFFAERLGNQLRASPNTVISYRDTFRLLLRYAADHIERLPTALRVGGYRCGSRRLLPQRHRKEARQQREEPEYALGGNPLVLQVCGRERAPTPPSLPARARHAIETVREAAHRLFGEIEAVIAAPDLSTWHGRRDRALLALALQTGLRVSELSNLSCGDVALGAGAHVRCTGKGRKERATPLRKDCVKVLRTWFAERRGIPTDPLFVSNRNQRLSRDAVERIVSKHVTAAARQCPSLKKKRITPHVLRHYLPSRIMSGNRS